MKKLILLTGSIIACLVAALTVVFSIIGTDGLVANGNTLVFQSASATAEYNGEALTKAEWQLVEGALKEGHTARVTVSGSQTEVGTSKNAITVTVVNEQGEDVSSQYNIQVREGDLTVTKRKIEAMAKSVQRAYDGTPLVCNELEVVDGEPIKGHLISASYSGEQTDVGSSECRMTLSIINEHGEDKSANYDIITHPGTLTVYKRRIALKSASADKVYNGTPLANNKITIAEGSLVYDHTLSTHTTGKLTGVGEITNTFSATIMDAGGNDVTDNYEIAYMFGTLRVIPAQISVYTVSANKIYDGTPLSCEEFIISSGTLATGESLSAVFAAASTNVGVYENKASFSVTNAAGLDTTKNYSINVITGTLEIFERSLIVSSPSDIKSYDGEVLTNDDYQILEGTSVAPEHTLNVVFSGEQTNVGTSKNEFEVIIIDADGNDVTSNYNVKSYFGDLTVTLASIGIQSPNINKTYDGITAKSALDDLQYIGELPENHRYDITIIGEQTNAGSCENSFSVKIFNGENIDVTENFDIDTIFGTITVEKRVIMIQSPNEIKIYDGMPLSSILENFTILGEVIADHTLDITITGEQTLADTSDNTFIAVVLDENGDDISANYDLQTTFGTLTVTKRSFAVLSPSETKIYDGEELSSDLEDLTIVGTLAPDHRHEITITGAQTDAGETSNSFILKIYDTDDQDVTPNYDLETVYGKLTVSKREIYVQSPTLSKEYDGTPLKSETEDITVIGTFAEDQKADITVTGEQIKVGESDNTFVIVILDKNDIDVSHNYKVNKTLGTLEITAIEIIIESPDLTKIFDGTPLECDVEELTITGTLLDGHKYDLATTASQTNVGTRRNTFGAKIRDAEDNDVTDCYLITPLYGYLTVTPREITVKSPSPVKTYDGTVLKSSISDMITFGELVEGHFFDIEIVGEQTQAGTSENKFTCKIVDEDSKDVTYNYDLTLVSGDLTVTKRQLSITSPSINEVYDATEKFSLPEECLIEGSVADGEELAILLPERHTDVFEGVNTINVTIERDGLNVISNYDLIINCGDFVIHPKALGIATDNLQKIYDGTPLLPNTDPGWHFVNDERPISGHSIQSITFESSITDVGMVDNVIQVSIGITGLDLTHNYEITYYYGNLKVDPLVVTFKSGSAEKVYDGTPLTCDECKMMYPTALPAGHTAVVVMTGERLSVGEAENTFTVDIINQDGDSVIYNYDINEVFGALVVKGQDENGTPGQGGAGGSGLNLDTSGGLGGGGGQDGPPVTVMEVKSEVTGAIYMRLMSFGDYNGREWLESNKRYTELLDGKYSYNYLASDAIKSAGNSAVKLEVINKSQQYMLPYYLSMETVDYELPNNDVMFTNSHDGAYSLKYYPYVGTGTDLVGVSSTYHFQETDYSEFVYKNYLTVEPKTREYMDQIIKDKKFSKDDPDIIAKVAYYIQNAAVYNPDYDLALDNENNIVIEFLDTYKEGVCRHYASAATLLFRSLGIPARYTIGYMGSTVANEWVEIKSDRGHAWVEVYINGVGWIMVEVTGGFGGGNGGNGGGGGDDDQNGATKPELTIRPINEYLKYNGSTLKHSGKLQGLSSLEALNYTYEVVVEGEISRVGKTSAVIKEFKLYNENKEDVTDQFSITFKEGTLQIYEYEIWILSGSATKTYDATPLSSSLYQKSGDIYVSGHVIEVECTGSITAAGSVSNSFNVAVYDYSDPSNPIDVTYCYKINKQLGKLTVIAKPLFVQAGSATKIFDGTPLTCDSYSFVNGTSLIEGHNADVQIQGSQKKIGESSNIIKSIKLTDELGRDVTGNYAISFISGSLFVSPP